VHHFNNRREIKDFIYHLKKKGRIVKTNRNKYYLVPIKAKSGKWSDNPFIIADEICNGKDYFIGGWAAANYWRLTEQIPMRTDVYTTRRQGKARILSSSFVFHRTSKKRVSRAVAEKAGSRTFRIIPKEDAEEWIKSRR
jgi:predicted transcriptional regulator of viral defense system